MLHSLFCILLISNVLLSFGKAQLVIRPLLLHASSSCAIPKSRRVIHLEFASAELPHGLDWHDRVAADRPDSVPKFDKVSL